MAADGARLALLEVVAIMLLVAVTPSHGAAVMEADGYFHGRATFYTDNQQGSCQYKTNIPSAYAAWPDTQQGFKGSCGTCWQVSCVNRGFTDGFGKLVDRSSGCYDESKAITVKIVDSCPCVHENFYSNQRWCCGDSAHIDLADTVFAQLANPSLGVVAARWRQVSCDQVGSVVQLDSDGGQPVQQQPQPSISNGPQQPWPGQANDFWPQPQQPWMPQMMPQMQPMQPLPPLQPMQPMQPMQPFFGGRFKSFPQQMGWGNKK